MGVKNKYNRKLALKIAAAIQNSSDSLEKICIANTEFPRPQSIRRWLTKNTHPEFTELYSRAKFNQTHYLGDRMLDIVNDAEPDKFGRVEKARLQIDTYKWLMSKLASTKYGDKLEIKDPDKPKDISSDQKLDYISNVVSKALERKNAAIKAKS